MHPFGGTVSTANFEQWLATKLDPPVIVKTTRKQKQIKIYGWTALGTFIGAVVFMLITWLIARVAPSADTIYFLLGLTSSILATVALVFSILWLANFISYRPKKAKPQEIPRNIYSQYYKLVYPGSPLKFNDVVPSTVYPGTKMLSFSIGNDFIEWNVCETKKQNNLDSSLFNFSMQYTLVATTKKLDEFDLMSISPRNDPKSAKNPEVNEFISPSMSFNQKYIVTSNNPDRIPVTRVFDPSVIHYFDTHDSWNIKANQILLGNGKATITWSSGLGTNPWDATIDDFSRIELGYEDDVQAITDKVTRDFNRFFINFDALRPFDFYHLYPQIN